MAASSFEFCSTPAANIAGMENLWDIAWRDQNRDELYETKPEQDILILKRFFDFGTAQPEKIVVREEYLHALRDMIIYFTGVTHFKTPYKKEDWEWCRWFVGEDEKTQADGATKVQKQEQEGEDMAMMDDEGERGAEKLDLEGIANSMDQPLFFPHQTFFMTGIPGIGKTLWLYFVLVERLLQNLPTYFQYEPDHTYFWNENGVFRIAVKDLGPTDIPNDVRYLIDLNADVFEVPRLLKASLCRIIISARYNQFEWFRKKASLRGLQWIMKPTPHRELLIMKECQPDQNWTRTFSEISARDASPMAYKDQLREEMESLNLNLDWLIFTMFTFHEQRRQAEDLSYRVIGLFPGPGRSSARFNVYSFDLFWVVKNVFASEWNARESEIYEKFRSSPTTYGLARYILEDKNRLAEEEKTVVRRHQS
ncbi:hypothetical protein VNI00_010998 [Paramarasmius palmivorus]|uniref:Uncharacterized protein n=1 Tax=Paramarasmius palmivorus TaxID=297713 RepID=A0AAW0CGT7_9AGAR